MKAGIVQGWYKAAYPAGPVNLSCAAESTTSRQIV